MNVLFEGKLKVNDYRLNAVIHKKVIITKICTLRYIVATIIITI